MVSAFLEGSLRDHIAFSVSDTLRSGLSDWLAFERQLKGRKLFIYGISGPIGQRCNASSIQRVEPHPKLHL
jgi:hypothetical protein